MRQRNLRRENEQKLKFCVKFFRRYICNEINVRLRTNVHTII